MKKLIRLFSLVLSVVCALSMCVACGTDNGTDGVTGIEDGQIYVIELGNIAAEFTSGSATLSKDGGAAADYASGTSITEAGQYVLVWKKGDKTISYSFTVKHKTPDAPVVTGVTDGQKIEYGTAVSATFDKGSAYLSKDGAVAEAYEAGTPVTEIGKYVLTVSFESVSTVVNFEITLPDYAGQMTDEFLGGVVNGGYVNNEDCIMSIENDALHVTDVDDANGYCLFRRNFKGLNLDNYPYVEFDVSEVQNCSVKFGVSIEQYIGASEPSVETRAYAPGKVYIDLKTYAADRGLDTTSANLWLQVSLEGKEFASGELSAVIQSIKSVESVPEEGVAGQYIDNTEATLNQWVANTAKIVCFEGSDQALGTVIDPAEGYGKALKRVQFNTKAYPYLIVDVADVVSGWKIESLSYENNMFVGTRKTIIAETSAKGKVEVNLQQIFGEDECVDVVLEFYIVGKSDDKFFTLNGLYTSADPLYPPVVSGISDGDVYNLSVHGPLPVSFDKGTATISRDGAAPIDFTNGNVITEAGEYTLTVKIGATMSTEVTFTVIERNFGENVIEDFLTESKFTVENGTFSVTKDGDEYVATLTKTGSDMTKLITRKDFDFTEMGVLVFEVYAGENFDVGGFGFEILDDVNWYRVLGKGNTANYTEEIKDASDNVVGYRFYYRVVAAEHTSGNGSVVSWVGALKNDLKLSVSLEFGDRKVAVLKSISLADSYPGESSGEEEGSDVIGTLVEDYNSTNGFTKSDEDSSAPALSYDDTNDEIALTTTGSWVKLSKNYNYNFADNGKYLVLVFETNGYTPDAGFSVTLRNESVGPWQNVQIRYPAFTYVETSTLASGRIQYICYIEVSGLTDMSDPGEFHDYTSVSSVTLVTDIIIEYGSGKTVFLKSLSQTDTLPEAGQPGMIEAYSSANGFSVNQDSATWGYDEVNDEVFLTKADGADATKIYKDYTFNFKDNGKYFVLTFETNGYTPDAGFSVGLLYTGSPWAQLKILYTDFAKVETTALENGRTQYVCYIEITGGTDLAEPFETHDWTQETSLTVQFEVTIEYGGEKTVYLKSLRQTDTLPVSGE
ncbi:MAG: hypothetical protein ACI4S9_08695 [Christensenellales bacterium]